MNLSSIAKQLMLQINTEFDTELQINTETRGNDKYTDEPVLFETIYLVRWLKGKEVVGKKNQDKISTHKWLEVINILNTVYEKLERKEKINLQKIQMELRENGDVEDE